MMQVTLKKTLPSYASMAESETYDWLLSTFVPGVLPHFDLPAVYQALESRRLRLI